MRVLILILLLLITLPVTTFSQRRSRTKPPPRKPAATREASLKQIEDRRAGAERVATQIKLLSRFLLIYGATVNGLENLAETLKQPGGSAAAQQQLLRMRASVVDSISNLRAALEELEGYFRTTPALQSYSRHVTGVAAQAASAEQLAAQGSYNEAGKSILAVVNRLADALFEMP